MDRASEHLKQLYSTTFFSDRKAIRAPFRGASLGVATPRADPLMHFFLDIRRKEPYKGDTSARSDEWREI
jgi:hypothetical protein